MLKKAPMFKKVKKIPESLPFILNFWILNLYLDLYEQTDSGKNTTSLVDVANDFKMYFKNLSIVN